MKFFILGRLEVRTPESGEVVPLSRNRERSILGALLLNRNRITSGERLIDTVWGDRPPRSAKRNMHTYIWRLRRLLSDSGASQLATDGPGYVLRVQPEELDAAVFDQQASEGERLLASGKAEQAATILQSALELWRDTPLADVTVAYPSPELGRLEEQRVVVLENRIQAELECGRHADLTPELRELAARLPLRERLRRYLMIALYRAGRTTEALDVYTETRRLLHEDFGIDPGYTLQRLQQEILTGGPVSTQGAD